MRWFQTGDVRPDIPLRNRGGDPRLRFWPKVNKDGPTPEHRPDLGPCWPWTASVNRDGYGLFSISGKFIGAHRFAFELAGGTIPEGCEIDHLCRNRTCVRASHLEAVPHLINMRRAHEDQTRCAQGHPLVEENLWRTKTGGRICKTCSRRRVSEFHERAQANPDAPLCAVDDCEKVARTRGWCTMHYARWLHHGDAVNGKTRAAPGEWRGMTCKVEGCEEPVRTLGWCNPHYRKWYRDGDPLSPDKQARPHTPLADRIEARIRRDGECWIWTGPLLENGYGRLNVGGRGRPVHRVAYEVYIGPAPSSLKIDQKCGRRACVNPDHLVAAASITLAKHP